MLDKLRGIVTANRVVALIGLAGSAAAFLVAIQTSLVPGSPAAEAVAKAIVALGSVAAFLKVVDRFLEGSQKWDALVARSADSARPAVQRIKIADATAEEPDGADHELAATTIVADPYEGTVPPDKGDARAVRKTANPA